MKSERLLYQVEAVPVFQNRAYDSPAEAQNCPKGDVELVESVETGLVYNRGYKAELAVYDPHYQNEQAWSPVFRRHLDAVASIVTRHLGSRNLVEIGCGKGFFLEKLASAGIEVIGVDPTYEGVNERVVKQYFHPGLGIRGSGVILRHVLEHIPNPVEFLFTLREANGGSGRLYIEVPCFDWICTHRAWFDVFYEHVNYFRLSDFHRLFGKIVESGRSFGGQYLYAVAELDSLRHPAPNTGDQIQFPTDFRPNFPKLHEPCSAIWGAASKGVIFALMMTRAGINAELAVDINAAKQGKYLPATGLPVFAPSDAIKQLVPGSTLYVMNSNYMEEIREMSHNLFNYVGIDHG
jgi:hypothetical protein